MTKIYGYGVREKLANYASALEGCGAECVFSLDGEEALDQLCPHCRQEAEAGRCPVCGRAAGQTDHGTNPAFDWARFTALKEETET